jgi:nucleotide-binding universal stress UspA family protein
MEIPVQKKILAVVDGSDQAREAVRYLSKVFPADKVCIVLFHVLNKIPESFWDMEQFRHKIVQVQAWELHQERWIKAYMKEMRQILLDAGFPRNSVTVKIQERKVGIARDIIAESEKDYSVVIVGRRGMSEVKDLVIGSVANKLVERLVGIPVWVVGGSPQPGKILISMDTSEGAMIAVNHVASMLDGSETQVTLFHAIRSFDLLGRLEAMSFVQGEDKEWVAKAEEEIGKAITPVFEESKKLLIQAGMHPDHIDTRIVQGVSSRAGSIMTEAERGGYGTIVVGRRGLSKVQDFFMGRVSSKVLQLAGNKAVWVVS